MVIPLVIGIILLVVAIYIGLKILKNLILGAVLLFLVFIAFFLIFGSIPSFPEIPFLSSIFQKVQKNETMLIIKEIFYNIDILDVTRDVQDNLLIVVANTGKLEVSNFEVLVNNQTAQIINSPKDPLKSGEVTIIQAGWRGNFSQITVKTKQASATFVAQ